MESPKTSTDEDAEKPLTPAERRQQLLRMKIRRSFNMFNMNGEYRTQYQLRFASIPKHTQKFNTEN